MRLLKKYFPAFLFIASFLLMAKVIFNSEYPDFRSYYYNPLLSLKGINPYLPNNNLFTPSVYPPFLFWFFSPLILFPFVIAEKLWTIGSIIALLFSLNLLFKVFNQKLLSIEGLILSSLAFLAFPTKFTLGMGQINIYILLLIALFIYFLNKSKTISGIFLGLSLMLKFFPIMPIIYLIKDKKWRILTTFFITLILGGILTLVFVNLKINTYFIQKILPTLFDSWKGDYYNQSLTGVIVRAGIFNNRELIRNVLMLAIEAPTIFVILSNKSKDKLVINLIIGILITLNLIINSFSWQHHFVLLLPSFFATYFYLKKIKAEKYLYYLLFFCYLLVSLNLKSPSNFPLFVQSHVFFGSLLLLLIQLRLLFIIHENKQAKT